MPEPDSTASDCRKQLRRLRIFTLPQLISRLSCSRRTAQRCLKAWNCHTSYNANSAYYCLPDVPRFNGFGIWRHKDAAFSQHGKLADTLAAVVEFADDGMTGTELSAILGVKVHSLLPVLMRENKLAREKVRAAFVYLSPQSNRRDHQLEARLAHGGPQLLSDTDAVTVLICFIQNPQFSIEQLTLHARARAPTASLRSIQFLFDKHGLSAGKKGASDSMSSP